MAQATLPIALKCHPDSRVHLSPPSPRTTTPRCQTVVVDASRLIDDQPATTQSGVPARPGLRRRGRVDDFDTLKA